MDINLFLCILFKHRKNRSDEFRFINISTSEQNKKGHKMTHFMDII